MTNVTATTTPNHVVITTPDGPVLRDLRPGQVLSTASTVETYRDREAAIAALLAADPDALVPDYVPPTRAEAKAARLEELTLATAVAARMSVDARIKTDDLPDRDMETLSALYDEWQPGNTFEVGDLRSWDGTIIECIQGHTNSDPSHTPDVTPALWRVHRTPKAKPWVQPTAENPYMIDDKVVWTDGLTYKSLIDQNVWSVSGYPQGWEVVPPT